MQSRFYHQHAADYLEAWTKLSSALQNPLLSLEDQVRFALDVRDSIDLGRKNRGGVDAGFTDTELAQVAACNEHIQARTGIDPTTIKYEAERLQILQVHIEPDRYNSVDPTTRGRYVIAVGDGHTQP